MDTSSGLGRLRAWGVEAASFIWHPLWGSLAAVVLAGAALIAFQATPGVPARLRPYTGYKHWRAQGFLTQAVQAHERGELNEARLALDSALTLNPSLTPARIQLARLAVDEGRFADAARQAATVGMDGTGFVHDMLFYSGRFDELLVYCARQIAGANGREGVWLQSALMVSPLVSAETRGQILRAPDGANQPASLLLAAILLTADRRHADAAAKLAERAALPGLDAAETLLGVELLMQSGDPTRAWVWLHRHRERLTDFDARCGDYRIESARDPLLARRILNSFPQLPLTDARWVRLTALVAARGGPDAARRVCQLLADSHPQPSAPLAVSAWALLLLNHQNTEAQTWEKAYHRAGGGDLPVLAGRKLADADPKSRSQAVRLLSSSAPLPREMISALLLR